MVQAAGSQRELAIRLLHAMVEIGARPSGGPLPKMAVWERFGASRPLIDFRAAVRCAESEGWIVSSENGFRLDITVKGYETWQALSAAEPPV